MNDRPALFFAIVALALSSAAAIAGAATNTATFVVSATVQATCLITADNLDFAAYTGAIAQATATITITCSDSIPYNLGLNAGSASGATVEARAMTSGGDTIAYALFRDPAYTENWGDTPGVDTAEATGTGSPTISTVYGQIAAGQYVAPSAYTDTVTATVTY